MILGMIHVLGNLLFGFLPEPATVLFFGVFMVASTIGLRRFLKPQKPTNPEVEAKETLKK